MTEPRHFPKTDRPPKNRRTIADDDLDYDHDVEDALRDTAGTADAVVIPLHIFHSSPAKGRLWKQGWRILHSVQLPKRTHVAAWVELEAEAELAPDRPPIEPAS